MRHDPLLGSHDLLRNYLDLKALAPDLSQWTEEQLQANPPRLVRLKRLLALFSAFGIPLDPEGFAHGRFFEGRPSSHGLYEKLWNDMPTPHRRSPERWPGELQDCFEHLLRYRERLRAVLEFNDGVMEASGLTLYAVKKSDDFNLIIQKHLPQIDDLLVLMISPEGTTFRRSELTAGFGYPDADLDEIDLRWF
jgi:hypothetical protein